MSPRSPSPGHKGWAQLCDSNDGVLPSPLLVARQSLELDLHTFCTVQTTPLQLGHENQSFLWHQEGLTQAHSPQDVLTHMCPWTGKALLTPCQLPPKSLPSPSAPLALVTCPEQMMSHWCPSFKAAVCRVGRIPTTCSSASPKGWCSSALGVSDAQPFNPPLQRGKHVL